MYILKPPAAGFYTPPSINRPPPLGEHFQGWGGGYKLCPPSIWEIAQLKRCDFAFALGRPLSWPLGRGTGFERYGCIPQSVASTGPAAFRKAPDTFNFLRHVMRAILFVRPKCSHGCVSLKETPLKPVQILKHTTKNSTEQTVMRTKWFKHIAILNCSGASPKFQRDPSNMGALNPLF